jgi:hypothetical protein
MADKYDWPPGRAFLLRKTYANLITLRSCQEEAVRRLHLAMICLVSVAAAQTAPDVDTKRPIPRTADGKPDLTGVWAIRENTANLLDLTGTSPFFFVPPDDKLPPFQPGGKERWHLPHAPNDDPTGFQCLPSGIPRQTFAPYPIQFVQTPKQIVILYEYEHFFRVIPVDGRGHPANPEPSWMGHSVGRWDGDTLVVDTVGLNDKTWLDAGGHMHSDQLHVVERYRLQDAQTIDWEVTIDDPKIFTKPWAVSRTLLLKPGWELLEYVCEENNREGLKGTYK